MDAHDLQQLARLIGVGYTPGVLVASDLTVDTKISAQSLRANLLRFNGIVGLEDVEFYSCEIDRLIVTDSEFFAPVTFIGCSIGLFDARSITHDTRISLVGCRVEEMLLHSTASLTLDAVTVRGTVTVSAINGNIELRGCRMFSLMCDGQGITSTSTTLNLKRIQVDGDFELMNAHLTSLSVDRLVAKDVRIGRISLDESAWLSEVRTSGSLHISGIRASNLPALSFADCRVQEDLIVRDVGPDTPPTPDAGGLLVSMQRVAIRGSCSIEPRAAKWYTRLERCQVRGGLLLSPPTVSYRVDDGTTIFRVDLPRQGLRSSGALLKFTRDRLGNAGVDELSIIRQGLHDRPREDDIAYFELRTAEMRSGNWWERYVERFVKGTILGWGVRIRNPASSLVFVVLGAWAAVVLLGETGAGSSKITPESVGRGFIIATALCLNVSVGATSDLMGAGWTIIGVLLAAVSLLFSTLIVGVVIRKLVR